MSSSNGQLVASQILSASGGIFSALVVALVALYDFNEINPIFRPINVPINQLQLNVDFIVIGAGTAGNVVTNRLTEIANWTVLLLEAGYDEDVLTDVPLANYMFWTSPRDWNYSTVPQENACRAIWNSTCFWPRGRLIGGSSALNDFTAIRGNSRDYDTWEALGNVGWSYNQCLPFFRRLEDNRYPPYAADREYHGVGGYQTIENPSFTTVISQAFINAGMELGYPNGDLNGAYQPGFMISQGILRGGRRCSTGKAYLRPARNRTNLQVSMGSYVTKILIGPQNKTAYGVQFTRNGRNITAYARMEVILSAGAVESPHLLLLSGVGPKEELFGNNISLIENLPVGRNLVDHIGVPLTFTVNVSAVTIASATTVQSAVEYAMNRSGQLTSPVGVEAIAFLNAPGVNSPWPHHEIVLSTFEPPAANPNSINLYFQFSYNARPQSRGTVTLQSSNPFQYPLIDPRYFTVESDFSHMIAALNNAIAVSNTTAMQKINSTVFFEGTPACLIYPNYSNEWLRCLAVNYSTSLYHASGTCQMSPTGVVDPRLRVHNITGLRVIDASIFPTQPTGNTNIPTIMVAERGADFIREDYGVTRAVLHDGNGNRYSTGR